MFNLRIAHIVTPLIIALMKKLFSIFLAAGLLIAGCTEHKSPRIVEDFNFGWSFILGDSAEYAESLFDDSGWRPLHLPHDWSVEGEFSKENPSTPAGGALPGGVGWYRKHFPTPDAGRVAVEFDGVFMNSTVYINGKAAGTRPYGYSSFSYDITSLLAPVGKENVIAVRCDNSDQPNSRWYAGCGIYRNVRLVCTSGTNVEYNGTFITTPEEGKVAAQVSVESLEEGDFVLVNEIADPEGRTLAQSSRPFHIKESTAGTDSDGIMKTVVNDTIGVIGLKQWDIEDPKLYSVKSSIYKDKELKDSYITRFGLRSFDWDTDKGFFLNGRNLKLLGVCLHHDMGCLGSAVHRRALERQLSSLKEMGVNAVRTSHNPPAPELLELCDEMGILVLDEAMDMWRKKKTQYDYSRFFDKWHEKDIRDFVKRDRNHPCVFMWSVGNEILEQWDTSEDDLRNLSAEQANLLLNFMSSLPHYESAEDNPNILLTKHMAAVFKEMDPTRPVTAGCNETSPSNNLLRSGALDVYGFNYHTWDYDKIREWYPDKPLFGSETASSLNSRGFYPQPSTLVERLPQEWWMTYETPHHQCSSYDACSAPWADLHEHAWMEVKTRDYMAGTFIWTGYDYLGEPTPYSWPSRSSYFGIFDLAGFPKDIYWMYRSEWTDDTVLHLFPHWNWTEGDTVDIWAYYSQADECELFVNGKSLGRSHKEGEQLRAQWLSVPFEPGYIEVVSYRDGQEVSRRRRETTGDPVAIRLSADRPRIAADGYDLSYITVEAVDSEGREVPAADFMLHFELSGAGELVGVDNGNAADTLCLKGKDKALFAGKALAVVRSLRGEPGTATLTVSSTVGNGSIVIKTE